MYLFSHNKGEKEMGSQCQTLSRERAKKCTFSSRRAESGRITGRKDRECGQMGVKSMQGTFGWTCIFSHLQSSRKENAKNI
jgi:hypothetical protein